MGRDGLFIGEVATNAGVSRKALRVYEAAGILRPPRRTASGYRVYDEDALAILTFVKQAQRLGFRLQEIKEIVRIRQSGRARCAHVYQLVRRKTAELDQALADLKQVRRGLRRLLRSAERTPHGRTAICPHIEQVARRTCKEAKNHGDEKDVAVPGVLGMSGGRNRRRRGQDR